MKDFRTEFKNLANQKKATRADMLQLCVFKAMTAKGELSTEERVIIAYNLLRRAFTPISNKNKIKGGRTPYSSITLAWQESHQGTWSVDERKRIRPSLSLCIENEGEYQAYSKITKDALNKLYKGNNEYHSFIFVRADLPSKEQWAVQSNHVSMKLGSELIKRDVKVDLDRLNHVLCIVRSENELTNVMFTLRRNGYKFVTYADSDLNVGVTALASFPIPAVVKDFMREHQLLNFN